MDTAMTTTSIKAPTRTTSQTRTQLTRSQILNYLARNGASKVSDITHGVTACKDTVKARLSELEEEGSIRANVPADIRGRTTPYYSLTTADLPPEPPKTIITVHIKHAADGRLTLAFDDYPGLTTTARSFVDIPAAARNAASRYTGHPEASFAVHIRF
ncbi:hypothetical protein NtRootA1_02820 [Arthrobacter sp. NtRootA1]|nr:hypothetical protein NtRootA1_02820 [Arthrobacter sp. NtRootA1]